MTQQRTPPDRLTPAPTALPWLVAAGIATAVGLAAYTRGRRTTALDLAVDGVVRDVLRPLFPLLDALVALAPPQRLFALCALLAGCAVIAGRLRTALLCVGGPGLALVVSGIGKELLGRPSATIGGSAEAYPSGHMTGMAATAVLLVLLTAPGGLLEGGLGRGGLWLVRAGAVLAALVFGTALTALRHHFVTDVVGAVAVAVAAVLVVAQLLEVTTTTGINRTSRTLGSSKDGPRSSPVDLDCEDPCQ